MARVLFYERLEKSRWMTKEEVATLLQALAQESRLASGKMRVAVSRDPEDDKFLAAAIEGRARYVVTGDNSGRRATPKAAASPPGLEFRAF